MPSRVLECDFSLHLGSGIETIGACSVKTFRYSKHSGLISSEFSTMNVSLYALSEFSDQGLAEAGDQRPASIEPRGRRIGSGAGSRKFCMCQLPESDVDKESDPFAGKGN